jgi:hypothetical protein
MIVSINYIPKELESIALSSSFGNNCLLYSNLS